ncbi:hypothetical protein D7030_11775 [Flavobacteriaceae bacterium AU392]|nr:hypothetical protein D1817_12895 [Flavobacteriaceae bacterium]RKM82830.1 hypothetical protein D7030_11775 [Flavobacteriaceae bacterium AU392]
MFIKTLKKKLSKTVKKIMFFLHYSRHLSFKTNTNKKRIIICFDGLFPHGGLVDRLKGMISFYEISKLLNYEFYIHFDNPFNLNIFLEPNTVNWLIKKKDIKWHPTKTKLIYVVNNFNVKPLELIKKSKADTFIVYANIDYLNSFHPLADAKALENKWRINFNELFKKTSQLNDKLNNIEQEKYIAFHTRFTSLMGDFVDSSTKTISEEQKQKLLTQLQTEVKSIVKTTVYKCYGFSDSVRFLDYIEEKEAVHLVEGNPFHMDNYKGNSTIEGHLKTMIDFFMIANSEIVYFLKIEPMYHSSFSKYAAIVGDKPFKMINK